MPGPGTVSPGEVPGEIRGISVPGVELMQFRPPAGFTPEYFKQELANTEKRIGGILDSPELNRILPNARGYMGKGPDVKEVPFDQEMFNAPEWVKAREGLNSVGLKFSAGVWYMTGKCGTRFYGSRVPDNELLTTEEAIKFLGLLGVKKFAAHTPQEVDAGNIGAIAKGLGNWDMKYGSIFANLFSDMFFKYGGITSPIPEVDELAMLMKKQSDIWCVQNGCWLAVDWLGMDGPSNKELWAEREQKLVDSYVKRLFDTGGKLHIAIEFKPNDPAEIMTETNVDISLGICEKVETRIKDIIRKQVMSEMGPDAKATAVDAEVDKRFKPYDHAMGINIEDAHVYLQTNQTVAHAVEKAIVAGRLFHRHPNDSLGAVDNDRIPGSVHWRDFVQACYLEQKSGVADKIFYEPDLFAPQEDVLKMFIETINATNRGHAVAKALIEIEWREGIESVFDPGIDHSQKEAWIREAEDMAVGTYRAIGLSLADRFRESIGKPYLFKPMPKPAQET